MRYILPIIALLVLCSCRSTKRVESTTADTIRIERSIERFALQHDSSVSAINTHDERFAFVVERITIDSSGKVLRRDVERGKFSARKADTLTESHNITRTITDSATQAQESHTAMREEKQVTAPRSIPILEILITIAVIAAIVWIERKYHL